jgi:hypothetical protein
MATSRMLATLPRTSIPVSSPVLLSRCDERARVYEEVSRSRSPDEERSLAAWIAMALEGRRVFEEPDAGSWWVTVHGRVVAVDGPIVSISGPEAVLLERYLAATILERREAACEALVELLEAPPSERRRRRLLGRMRQLVPERDRLDGDWSDRPANNLLAHWRLVGELKLRPRPGLVAFWRGLAVWDRRSGEGMDLRTAYQRWQAARLADRLVADGRSELMASVARSSRRRRAGPRRRSARAPARPMGW